MVTFFIETDSDSAYSFVLDFIIKKSLIHSKSMKGRTLIIEIQGSEEDYKFFEKELHIFNRKTGYLIANIYEGI